MAYSPTTWVDGSPPAITAERLNKLEQGVKQAHDNAEAVRTGGLANLAVKTAALDNKAVTNAKLRDSSALSVIGRATSTSGEPGDIAAGSEGYVLRRAGNTLGFGTVATTGLADGAVTTAKVNDSAVTTVKLGNLAVTTAKLANNAVTADKLANSAVVTSRLNNAAVTADKLAGNAVTTAKIADKAVTRAKMEDVSARSILGRSGGSAGVPQVIAAPNERNLIFGRTANGALAFQKPSISHTPFAIFRVGENGGYAMPGRSGILTGATRVRQGVYEITHIDLGPAYSRYVFLTVSREGTEGTWPPAWATYQAHQSTNTLTVYSVHNANGFTNSAVNVLIYHPDFTNY